LNSISIEIIPFISTEHEETSSYHPLLFVDGHLGIPEPVLYKAYTFASRKNFHVTLQSLKTISSQDITELLITSNIILLANPAHNTALNCRKLLLRKFPEQIDYRDELKLVACILESSKQASKSSILWHHRRWVFRHVNALAQNCGDILNGCCISNDELALELDLVSRATEIYPRNYHAWLHRYICSEVLLSQVVNEEVSFISLLLLELSSSRRLVELHVSDYSAMNYFVGFWHRMCQMNIRPPKYHLENLCEKSIQERLGSLGWGLELPLVSHSLSLLLRYPTHQSLWAYLRQACRVDVGSEQRKEWMYRLLEKLEKFDGPEQSGLFSISCQEIGIDFLKREIRSLRREVEGLVS
jgi:protein prenyltransferase alpha subunit repeat containing protein 1